MPGQSYIYLHIIAQNYLWIYNHEYGCILWLNIVHKLRYDWKYFLVMHTAYYIVLCCCLLYHRAPGLYCPIRKNVRSSKTSHTSCTQTFPTCLIFCPIPKIIKNYLERMKIEQFSLFFPRQLLKTKTTGSTLPAQTSPNQTSGKASENGIHRWMLKILGSFSHWHCWILCFLLILYEFWISLSWNRRRLNQVNEWAPVL